MPRLIKLAPMKAIQTTGQKLIEAIKKQDKLAS